MFNFAFLKAEWPELQQSAERAEALALTDPRVACFYARRSLEAQGDGWRVVETRQPTRALQEPSEPPQIGLAAETQPPATNIAILRRRG